MIRAPGWHSGRSSNSVFLCPSILNDKNFIFQLKAYSTLHILQELLATRSADIVVMDLQLKIETTTAGIKTVHRVLKEHGGTVTVSSQI